MSISWQSRNAPDPVRITPLGWALVLLRTPLLAGLVFGGLAVLLLLRLAERPLFGPQRPLTPFLTQAVCRGALRILGIRLKIRGGVMRQRGAIVANHASWLDIFALNALSRIYFVSKAEVAAWPGIGWLARATGTLFIERNPKQAREQARLLEIRLLTGHQLLFFPEGTSTDGLRVLPFKPTLFAPFFSDELNGCLHIQPISVVYHAPASAPARHYGWWGDMDFGSHLLKVLATPRQGRVELICHPPLAAADFAGRKDLASHCANIVRSGHEQALRAAKAA